MTNKLSYVHKGCNWKSPLSRLFWYFISFLAKWAAVHSLVLFTLTLSHISDTRWFRLILYDPYFGKNSWTSAIKRLATKKDLGPFKIDRAVVDSSRSVNLLFNIRKILCTYPRKRKDIRCLQMFQIGDLSSSLAGGWLASGAEICSPCYYFPLFLPSVSAKPAGCI